MRRHKIQLIHRTPSPMKLTLIFNNKQINKHLFNLNKNNYLQDKRVK